MITLSSFDLFLIFIYFGVLLLIGYLVSRKESKEDFLIAERKLGPWSTMATMNASKTGSIVMIFVAMVYLWGFSAIWYMLGIVLGVLFFIPFALKIKAISHKKFYTLADYFNYKFGRKSAIFASLITIFLMFGFLVINLIAGTKIFVFFTLWPFWVCSIIMMLVVLIYIWLGGFKAVVKTDIIQYVLMIGILILLTFSLFNGSLIPSSEWNPFRADIGSMIGFFLIGILHPFAMPDLWRRVYSAKDKSTVKKGIFSSAIIYFVFASLLALLALTVKSQFPSIDPDFALVHGFSALLPSGLLGLSTILLFASIMSSADTYLFTGSSAIVQDFFRLPKEKIIKHMRLTTLIFAISATILGIVIQDLILSSYIFISFIVSLALVVISTYIKKRIRQTTLLYGFYFGVIGNAILLFYYIFTSGIQPIIVIYSLILTLVGLLVGGIISFIKKQNRKPLQTF